MKRTCEFFKNNWAYLLWFIIYFSICVGAINLLIQNIWLSLLCAIIVYGISISLALCPLGEIILRMTEGANPVATSEDINYLIPLFNEVYEEAKEYTPKLRQDIKLYIIESMIVNAYAMGRKTIAVTRGAIVGLEREQLKGILAHEFGHVAHGDTKALLIHLVGNGFFSVFIMLFKFFIMITQTVIAAFTEDGVMAALVHFMGWLTSLWIDLCIFAFMFIGEIIISLNSRHSEYLADEYAFQIGYGEELVDALYFLSKITLPVKLTLTERMRASHPYMGARIQRLENMIDNEHSLSAIPT